MSTPPLRTTALPSGSIRAAAVAGLRCVGYTAVAIPRPMRYRPSRIERGALVRRFQSNAAAPEE
jgi:hypothetical protein